MVSIGFSYVEFFFNTFYRLANYSRIRFGFNILKKSTHIFYSTKSYKFSTLHAIQHHSGVLPNKYLITLSFLLHCVHRISIVYLHNSIDLIQIYYSHTTDPQTVYPCEDSQLFTIARIRNTYSPCSIVRHITYLGHVVRVYEPT